MRSDVEAATERIVAIRARLAGLPDGAVPADDIEDALCAGYAEALAGDAWLTHAEERLHELIDDPTTPIRAREIRRLSREHRDYQHSVIALRRELEALRQQRRRLRPRTTSR